MNTQLKTTHNEAEQQLTARISKGNDLLSTLPKITNDNELQTVKTEFKKWDDYNRDLLGTLFTTNEIRDGYKDAHFINIGIPEKTKGWEKVNQLKGGITLLLNELESIKDRLKIFPSDASDKPTPVPSANVGSKKVFIVHGSDAGAKETVARCLEKLGLDAVILHEQRNQGQTLIEKFEKNAAESSFAVVLLTPDDKGFSTDAPHFGRPRQNVILELGYFIGKLGRDKVCALYKSDTEIPSDIHGIVYVPFDEHDAWKTKLAKELKSAGFQINSNALLV